MNIENTFKANLESLVEDCSKQSYLLAVSGGLDSTVMCHLFRHSKLKFALAHCNFNLRAEESDADEDFICELAVKNRIPLYLIQFETKKILDQGSKSSLQMLARELRYEWFNKLMLNNNFDYLITAHHLNDSIETVLYNFSQGTGIAGMCGIPSLNKKIIRPIGNIPKSDLYSYAQKNKIEFREDSSNLKNDYRRNQIRNEVVPELEEMNPAFVKNAGKTIQNLREANKIYQAAIESYKSEFTHSSKGNLTIDIEALKKSIAPNTILYEIIKEFGFTADTANKICALTEYGKGQYFHSQTHNLLFSRKELLLSKNEPRHNQPLNFANKDSKLVYGSKNIELRKFEKGLKYKFPTDPKIAHLDSDKLADKMSIRTWVDGDKFQPLGMDGKHQKLQDFFSNNRINRNDKDQIPLLISQDEICWVMGYRIDERFKVTAETKMILEVRYH